jgi:hypothetical protein
MANPIIDSINPFPERDGEIDPVTDRDLEGPRNASTTPRPIGEPIQGLDL